MKKTQIIFSMILTPFLLAVCMTIPICAEDTVKSGAWGDLSWMLDETTGELVIWGEGEMNSLVDTPVWRTYSSSIKTVVIREGVKSIGNYAFSGCSNLSSITIPNSVTSIGYLSFWNCSGLREITIPNTCLNVSDDAFVGCDFINTVTIPTNAIRAFRFCYLENVTISGGTSIPNNAFSGKSRIISIVLPDSITKIGDFAFYDCSSLKSVNIPQDVNEIGNMVFYGCQSLESVVLPENVIILGDSVFQKCQNLQSVVLPQKINEIGENMFDGCKSLAYFTIPESVERIGSHAFDGCQSLLELIIPNSVKEIGDFALANCSGLKKLVIPKGIETMSGYALDGTYNIETLTLPTPAISFVPKNYLKIVIFNRGNSISSKAFAGCTALEKVVFCGSEDEWKNIQKNQTWLKDLKDVSFTYHSSQWEVVDDLHVGTCSGCNTEIRGEHIWDNGSIILQPSHISAGLKEYSCAICQKTKEEILDKTTLHIYDTLINHDEIQHKKVCICGDIVYVDHNYGEWKEVTPATEQSIGERQRNCICGKTVSESIPRLIHEYVDTVMQPTCSEQGYTLHTCKNCGDSYKDTYVDILEHVYDDNQDKTCNNCNALREDISTEKAENSEVISDAKIKNSGCNGTVKNEFVIVVFILIMAAFHVKEKQN